jgi:phosphoglycolate phosphatase
LTAAGLDPGAPGALDRFVAHYEIRLTAHTRPYPGIPDALAALHASGRTLAVLTNKPQRATSRILEILELAPMLSHIVGGDTPAGRKPDPTGLLDLIEVSGATVASTVLVGDSPIDLETARRAGTRICLARYGFGYRFPEGVLRGDELFVDSPAELVEVVG